MDSLVETLQRAAAAIDQVHAAFGAPGDYGYGTRQGDALFALYKAGYEVRAAATLTVAHDRRVTELLEASNRDLERRRAVEDLVRRMVKVLWGAPQDAADA